MSSVATGSVPGGTDVDGPFGGDDAPSEPSSPFQRMLLADPIPFAGAASAFGRTGGSVDRGGGGGGTTGKFAGAEARTAFFAGESVGGELTGAEGFGIAWFGIAAVTGGGAATGGNGIVPSLEGSRCESA